MTMTALSGTGQSYAAYAGSGRAMVRFARPLGDRRAPVLLIRTFLRWQRITTCRDSGVAGLQHTRPETASCRSFASPSSSGGITAMSTPAPGRQPSGLAALRLTVRRWVKSCGRQRLAGLEIEPELPGDRAGPVHHLAGKPAQDAGQLPVAAAPLRAAGGLQTGRTGRDRPVPGEGEFGEQAAAAAMDELDIMPAAGIADRAGIEVDAAIAQGWRLAFRDRPAAGTGLDMDVMRRHHGDQRLAGTRCRLRSVSCRHCHPLVIRPGGQSPGRMTHAVRRKTGSGRMPG